jgi:drug/metabolite transporter (DMT)-like permease
MDLLRGAGQWLFAQPYLLLALTALFWSGNIVFGRFIAESVPPVTIAFIRWAGAFLLVLPFAWHHLKRDHETLRRHFWLMSAITISGISAYNTIAYWGLNYTQAINALLLQSTNPLHIALWTLILFGDRLTAKQWIGVSISLTGVLVIISRGDPAVITGMRFNIGDILIFLALTTNGIYSALLKRRPDVHPLSFMAFTMGWGAAWLIPLLAWEVATVRIAVFNTTTVPILIYIFVFPGLLAYFFFNRGVELIGPNRAAPFLHLIPVFGSVLAILFLGERPQLFHGVGYALVLCGIAIATRK